MSKNIGLPLKKGQLVRLEEDGLIYEVEKDVEWWPDFNSWGSVWLKSLDSPRYTHKGGIEVIGVIEIK